MDPSVTPEPIAITSDGQPVIPAVHVPPGSPQPFRVPPSGQPVWPVPSESVPPGAPVPFGISSDGSPLWAQAAQGHGGRSAWQKRVLIPAGIFTLLVVAGVAGCGEDSTDNRATGPSSSAPVDPTPPASPTLSAADQAAADQAAAAKAAADKAAAAKGPASQQAVLAAVVAGRQGYEATDNELKQRQAQQQRSDALRAALPAMEVADWVGKIRSIDTNGEGKAVVELGIGDDTKLSTWNNALSDISDNTLIPMESPMYEALIAMEEGDEVRFSGTFFPDDEQGLGEQSMTFNGQMSTPNFVFRFSTIAPA